jgi:hypothetical protein
MVSIIKGVKRELKVLPTIKIGKLRQMAII